MPFSQFTSATTKHKLGQFRGRKKKKSGYKARKSVQLQKKSGFPLHRNTRRDKVKTQKAEKDERDYDLVKKRIKERPKKRIGDQVNVT